MAKSDMSVPSPSLPRVLSQSTDSALLALKGIGDVRVRVGRQVEFLARTFVSLSLGSDLCQGLPLYFGLLGLLCLPR